MALTENPMPNGRRAHGRHRLPPTIIGGAIRRAAGVHYITTTASLATTAATIAQIAVSVASGGADARLPPRRGYRPQARFAASSGLLRAPRR